MTHKYIEGGKAPIYAWVEGVELEEKAKEQLINVASLPFIYKHVAVMPDCHLGVGATIGSVAATLGAIVPSITGVDLGCGCLATRINENPETLLKNPANIRSIIEKSVPHGRTNNGGKTDRGAWHDAPLRTACAWNAIEPAFAKIVSKHPDIAKSNNINHLGTLGTGNHFIEVCLDEFNRPWIMLHSGSRGVGNRIGSYFIERAKKGMEKYFIKLDDPNLAYLPEETPDFDDYIEAMIWAQNYAKVNREVMMNNILDSLRSVGFNAFVEDRIDCHHNFCAKEHHFGKNVWVTRKGAVRARTTDKGIILGSMGAKSFIVKGKGNKDSFETCSHGAGRKMSRGEAKKRFTVDDHKKAMVGIEARTDSDVIDETPGAYKSIEKVMEAQQDLIEIVHTLKQYVVVKG